MKRVFVYGAASVLEREEILASLPKGFTHFVLSPEHYGRKGGIFSINWDEGKCAARRRNCVAAMYCAALVVVKKPKFVTSVVAAFRQKGRPIFWWNGTRLVEALPPLLLRLAYTGHEVPRSARWEPSLWDEAREEKQEEIRDFLDSHPEAQRFNIDWKETSIPSWYRDALKKNPDLWRWADVAVQSVKKTDICEWSARQERKERNLDWKQRSK
jgi:hypothetical protein